MSAHPEFDLDTYLARLGWNGARRPDAETLRAVHRAHLHTVPFENLDPLRGLVPSLDVADLAAKLLRGDRGGYCYEQNTLMAHALRALGFPVTLLAARVVVGAATRTQRPRTHMALLVDVPGERRPRLADVGFGSRGGLVEPIPLVAGVEVRTEGRRHRLAHVPADGPLEMWVLQAYEPAGAGWADQYAFTTDPSEAVDFEVANWYVATHPRSPFTRRLFVQRTTGDVHRALVGRDLTETSADATVTTRVLADEAEVREVLASGFGVVVPRDTDLGAML